MTAGLYAKSSGVATAERALIDLIASPATSAGLQFEH